MTTIYSARWVLPVSAPPIENGAVAVEGQHIVGVGQRAEIMERFPEFCVVLLGEAVIFPGLVNTHTHFELTALRGYLENEEPDFFAWLRKLTIARLERMTPDDILVSATWGACEAVRAGITCVGDASDSAMMSMLALRDVGQGHLPKSHRLRPFCRRPYHIHLATIRIQSKCTSHGRVCLQSCTHTGQCRNHHCKSSHNPFPAMLPL